MILFLAFILGFFISKGLCQEPRFDVVTKNVTVVADQTAILPCSVDYLGTYKVVWLSPRGKTLTFEDRRIIADERISLERPYVKDWNLHVRRVKPSDTGTYLCQINTDPVQVRPVMLHVQEKARIIDHLSSDAVVTTREGETISLVCNVTGSPPPVVTWYRIPMGLSDGLHNEKKRIGAEGEVLVIHNVSRYCDDEYECVAYNNVLDADTRQIRVRVEFSPEVRLPNKKIGQSQGRSTILECEVTAYPQIMTVWRRNGAEITRSDKYSTEVYNEGANKITLTLKIPTITADDYGEYECFAKNSLGTDSETMILYEYRKKKITTTTTSRTPIYYDGRESRINHGGQFEPTEEDSEISGREKEGGHSAHQTQNGRRTGSERYPSYNNWQEHEYEKEAEHRPVISDPHGNSAIKKEPSLLHIISYTLPVLIVLLLR